MEQTKCLSPASASSIVTSIDQHRMEQAQAALSTWKEELLLSKMELNLLWVLRKVLNILSATEAMELLCERLAKSASNDEFLDSLTRG